MRVPVCGSCIHTWLVSVCKYLHTRDCVHFRSDCCRCVSLWRGGWGEMGGACNKQRVHLTPAWEVCCVESHYTQRTHNKVLREGILICISALLRPSCATRPLQQPLTCQPTSPTQTLPSTQPAADGTRWDRVVSGSSYFPPLSSLSMSPESILGSLCRCWSAESDSAWWRRRRTDVPLMVRERNYPKPTVNHPLPADHTRSYFPLAHTHIHTHTHECTECDIVFSLYFWCQKIEREADA